jgi:hypothetical protein
MKRMVVIATVKRGAVTPHELVSAEIETKIFERMFAEASSADSHVCWRTGEPPKLPPRRFEPRGREERMLELARKVG